MAECSNKMEVADAADQIQINSIADDKIDWVLVQDSNGETRLMTQADVVRNTNQISDLTGPSLGLHEQESSMSTSENIQHYTDINNDIIQDNTNTVVSTTFSNEEDDMETLRSADELSMEKQDCLSAELNFKNSGSHIELVMDEDLDSSLTNDGNLLEHISRQIAIQQPYLNPDSSGHPMTYHIEEIPIEVLGGNPSFSDSFTIVPNMMNQSQHTWYQTPPQPVDLRVSSHKNNFEPVTIYTPTSHNQTQQHVQFVPTRNSTPVTMHSILQPIGTNESGRYVYTPHPKTGQVVYMSENTSPYVPRPINKPTTQTQSKATNTCKKTIPKFKPIKTPEVSMVKKSVSSPTENKENTSPGSYRSHGNLDLDFPMLLSNIGEESREQHNMKERKRRARIKDACEVMRKLVPGMSDKTDKATVFEFAARYIHFLKGFTGNEHDKDFLLKYSPY